MLLLVPAGSCNCCQQQCPDLIGNTCLRWAAAPAYSGGLQQACFLAFSKCPARFVNSTLHCQHAAQCLFYMCLSPVTPMTPCLVSCCMPCPATGAPDRFVFECLSGVRQEGVMGAVLADGMGLGKTFQVSLYKLICFCALSLAAICVTVMLAQLPLPGGCQIPCVHRCMVIATAIQAK